MVEIGKGDGIIAVIPAAHCKISLRDQNQITIQSSGGINLPTAKYGRFESMVRAKFIKSDTD